MSGRAGAASSAAGTGRSERARRPCVNQNRKRGRLAREPLIGAAWSLRGCSGGGALRRLRRPPRLPGVEEPAKVAQASGAYEKDSGWKINWKRFDSGADILAAISSNAVQVAYIGSPPFAAAASRRSRCFSSPGKLETRRRS